MQVRETKTKTKTRAWILRAPACNFFTYYGVAVQHCTTYRLCMYCPRQLLTISGCGTYRSMYASMNTTPETTGFEGNRRKKSRQRTQRGRGSPPPPSGVRGQEKISAAIRHNIPTSYSIVYIFHVYIYTIYIYILAKETEAASSSNEQNNPIDAKQDPAFFRLEPLLSALLRQLAPTT